jgi:hypothetical protein
MPLERRRRMHEHDLDAAALGEGVEPLDLTAGEPLETGHEHVGDAAGCLEIPARRRRHGGEGPLHLAPHIKLDSRGRRQRGGIPRMLRGGAQCRPALRPGPDHLRSADVVDVEPLGERPGRAQRPAVAGDERVAIRPRRDHSEHREGQPGEGPGIVVRGHSGLDQPRERGRIAEIDAGDHPVVRPTGPESRGEFGRQP